MSKTQAASSAARDALRAFAPKLVDLTDNVLFGDVWERSGLSKRDRSLITCAAASAASRASSSDRSWSSPFSVRPRSRTLAEEEE